MKKLISLLLVTTLFTTLFFTGCNPGENDNKATQATETTVAKENSNNVLSRYFKTFVEGDNPLFGTWQMENFDYISFIFRNDNLAEMVMGTEGNFTALKMDEAAKTIEVSFVFGLNGTYSYKLSDDNKTLTLTQNGTDTILKKKDDYNFVPEAPEKPVVDEAILGWWKSEEQQIYYFGSDGLMYSNNISIETCYTYEASSNKIKAVYNYGEDITDQFDYKMEKDGKLNIKGNLYSPYDPFE